MARQRRDGKPYDCNFVNYRESMILINDYYESLRTVDNTHLINIRMIERQFDLPSGKLRYFRANAERRRKGKINLIHESGIPGKPMLVRADSSL